MLFLSLSWNKERNKENSSSEWNCPFAAEVLRLRFSTTVTSASVFHALTFIPFHDKTAKCIVSILTRCRWYKKCATCILLQQHYFHKAPSSGSMPSECAGEKKHKQQYCVEAGVVLLEIWSHAAWAENLERLKRAKERSTFWSAQKIGAAKFIVAISTLLLPHGNTQPSQSNRFL